MTESPSTRTIGLSGATGIGVGAIVGGGILALSGSAFALTGPGALLAFALNGAIAIVTALSFAELATAFPVSGGAYVFAKRVLSVSTAFGVGWVVWFASIVASALYAAGFAAFALEGVRAVVGVENYPWLSEPFVTTTLAIFATLICASIIVRSTGGGGNLVNVGKVLVFAILIGGGVWVGVSRDSSQTASLLPFLPAGPVGLLQAMGATFIALQGFDLIAAVAGEVKEPRRVLPRAMLYSLFIALLVYLPLLAVICWVGLEPGEDIRTVAMSQRDTVVALAVSRYLGSFGYWLVIIAGVLSMISALLANLFAAARIARAMALDRTLLASLRKVHPRHGTPWAAIFMTAAVAGAILCLVGDVAAAGAASSLIFLLVFAMCHGLCLVTRKRKPYHNGFRVPLWPWLPLVGMVACGALAVYQAVVVPSAGLVTGAWLAIGGFAFAWHFGSRAKVFDAATEAVDPDLLELRGRSPLVLAPVANPGNAERLAQLASCLAPDRVGRVLLLSVVLPPKEGDDDLALRLQQSSDVMRESLGAAMRGGVRCEALTTVASEPWGEIERVATVHRCASVLLGLSQLGDAALQEKMEHLAAEVSANVVYAHTPEGWSPNQVQKVLVPIGGRSVHDALRARLLAGLARHSRKPVEVSYLLVDGSAQDERERRKLQKTYSALVGDETSLPSTVHVEGGADPVEAIVRHASDADLVLLGLGRRKGARRILGGVAKEVIARHTAVENHGAVLLISARS